MSLLSYIIISIILFLLANLLFFIMLRPAFTSARISPIIISMVFGSLAILASYLFLGQPSYLAFSPNSVSDIKLEHYSDEMLLSRLERRLTQQPDDIRALTFSFPLYMKQGRYGDAAWVMNRLISVVGEKEEFLLDYAEALFLQSDFLVTEKMLQVIKRALEINGKNAKALYYRGLAYLQQGEGAKSKKYWQKALTYLTADELLYAEIKTKLLSLDNAAMNR